VGIAFVFWPDLRVVVFSLQVLKPSRTGEVLSNFLSNYYGFNEMLLVIGTFLPKEHSLPRGSYEAQKLLRVLKMPYEAIDACTNGCVLFRKEHADAKYCPKCKSSRYLELDSGGGHKRQLDVPLKILRYLPFILRITRMYMTEETAKQMTWHKTGK
jgi:hypothetical protein